MDSGYAIRVTFMVTEALPKVSVDVRLRITQPGPQPEQQKSIQKMEFVSSNEVLGRTTIS